MEHILERRLSCNRIFRHLMFYHSQGFTGKIKVYGSHDQSWSFYFLLGHLIWAYGGNYPLRRWRRQFFAATGQLPELDNIQWEAECFDCTELRALTQANHLKPEQAKRIVQGTIKEIFFDVVQAFENPLYQHVNNSKTLLSLSQLTGIGDGMQLEVEEGMSPDPYYRLPYSFFPLLEDLQKLTYEKWMKWVNLGLCRFSPNQAPFLMKPEILKMRVSEKVYDNMSKGLLGKTSLRDLAFKFKQGSNFLKLAGALASYVEQELITFKTIQDLHIHRITTESYSTLTWSDLPQEQRLLLVVDSNRDNQGFLSSIGESQGYTVQLVNDSINAVHQLIRNPRFKPNLIFVSEEMSVMRTTEFCTILRRIELFKEIPIIIYGHQFKDKKQIRELFRCGATDVIDENLFTFNHISFIIVKHSQTNKTNQETIIQELPQPKKNQNNDAPSSFRLTMDKSSFSFNLGN